jgi:hypothetical protein
VGGSRQPPGAPRAPNGGKSETVLDAPLDSKTLLVDFLKRNKFCFEHFLIRRLWGAVYGPHTPPVPPMGASPQRCYIRDRVT